MKKNRKHEYKPVEKLEIVGEVLERYRNLLNDTELSALLEELERPLYPGIRINQIKEKPATIEDLARRYNWKMKPVPYCNTGWQVTEASIQISHTIEHRFGSYYIQEAASMMPPELFDFSNVEGPLVLDMAASPGGKTTHMVDKIRDSGLVLANDSSRDRITALRLVLQNWGAINQMITQFPGEMFGLWFPEKFDFVLLDAPCSMQGLRTTESHPMRAITENEIESLAQRQTRLLISALQAVKTGGQVVYSTCTLEPKENEGVIDTLIKAYPDQIDIVNLEDVLPIKAPALETNGEQFYHPEVQKTARLWPQLYRTSGFFGALLVKKAPIANQENVARPRKTLEENGFNLLPKPEQEGIRQELNNVFGFDLQQTQNKFKFDLFKRGKQVFAIPGSYLQQVFELPLRSIGLLMGEITPDGFLPSHEWVSRFFDQFKHSHLMIPFESIDPWLKGMDLRGIPPNTQPKNGKYVIVIDNIGRYLGRGKSLPGRLRNLIPKRLILQ